MKEQAGMLVKTGFLPKDIKTAEQAIAVMLKGRELNVPPMQAFASIHVIQGKPAISAELMLSLIYRNVPGAVVNIVETTNDTCVIEAKRPGGKVTKFAFSAADAQLARLTNKDTWRQYPRAMMRARCISEMARALFPDALMGCVYTPEELGKEVDESGEVIEAQTTAEAPAKSQPAIEAPPDDLLDGNFSAPPKAAKKPYDGSPPMRSVLNKMLANRKDVPKDLYDEVSARLTGRFSSELDEVIKEMGG